MKRALVLAVAVALVAPACGGGSRLTKAEYERQVNRIAQQLSDTLETTFSSPEFQNPSSLKDAADVLRQAQKDMERAADRLEEVNGPEEIESIHVQFVNGVRDFAGEFGTFADATEEGDLPALQRFGQQIADGSLPSMVAITRATEALEAKGYDITNE